MSETRITRGKKACTECRQQKARCDAYLNPNKPCSRCRKGNSECVISDPFKRENKRQKLDELQRETDQLRQQLRTSQPPNNTSPQAHAPTERTESSQSFAVRLDGVWSRHSYSQRSPTISRTLQGTTLSGSEIDDLFEIYFQDFGKYLPVINSSLSPNEHYHGSPFIFWALVGVASRLYSRNTALANTLRSPITDLALEAVKSAASLESIQGLLILTTWPFPKPMEALAPTYAFVGVLLHHAMDIGLHVPISSHEFSRFKLRLSESEINERAEIWAHCVITHQRISLCKGHPCFTLRDVCQSPNLRQILRQRISKTSDYQLRTQDIVARCCKTLSENGLRDNMTTEQEHSLDIMIKTFYVQAEDMHIEAESGYEKVLADIARLSVLVFHFFKTPSDFNPFFIIKLFTFSCNVIDGMDTLPKVSIRAWPYYMVYGILSASHVLLRLVKVPSLSSHIDTQKATGTINTAISLARQMSIEASDVAARTALIVSQMLGSSKVYRDPNNSSAPVPLRVRSRLAVSHFFDGTAWWREEFGGLSGVYPPPLATSSIKQTSSQVPVPDKVSSFEPAAIIGNESQMLLDPTTEMNWNEFDDIFSSFFWNQV